MRFFCSNQYEDMNFLEMEETIKSEIDEENVHEYIKGYLQSRNLKKEDLKRREHTQQKVTRLFRNIFK